MVALSAPAEAGPPLSFPRRLLEGVLLAATVSLPYMFAGHTVPPQAQPMVTPWDALIPFVPSTIWLYLPGYFSIFLITVCAVRGAHAFRAALGAVLALTLLALPFFVLYPVAGPRPPTPVGDDLSAALIRALHSRDPVGNTFPSLHVANSCLCAWITWQANRRLGLLAGLLALGVSISTVTMKQHFLIDIPAGMLLAAVGVGLWQGWARALATRSPRPALEWIRRLRRE